MLTSSLTTRAPWIHLLPMPNLFRGEYNIFNTALTAELTNEDRFHSLSEADEQLFADKYAGEYAVLYRVHAHRVYLQSINTLCTLNLELAREIVRKLVAEEKPPSVFIAECLSGNAGGVEIPRNYLQQIYQLVHDLGGELNSIVF